MEKDLLPEKCCAKCGFLYGLTVSAQGLEYAIFDPDLIRVTDSKPDYRDAISSFPYLKILQKLPKDTARLPRMQFHALVTTRGFYCHKKKFSSISTDWNKIKNTIQEDRENCDGFYQYHPGYTPKEHIALQLEEIRIRRQDRYETTLIDLQSQSNNTQNSLKRATWFLTFATIGLLLATLALVIVTISTSQITPTPTYTPSPAATVTPVPIATPSP